MKRLLTITLIALLPAAAASAHFIYIVPTADRAHADIVFSEDFVPDEGVEINLIKDIDVTLRQAAGDAVALDKQAGEHAYRVDLGGDGDRVVYGKLVYGVYKHGDKPAALLHYYPKAILGDPFAASSVIASDHAVELIPTGSVGAVRFKLVSRGQPVEGAKVTVFKPDGHSVESVTDAEGLTEAFEQQGEYAMWSKATIGGEGEYENDTYAAVHGYATLCVRIGDARKATADEPAENLIRAEHFGELPEAVASFGAVASDGYVYVYGGHIARTHVYDTEAVSGQFHRRKLAGPATWERLPEGPALQGMNLAAHDGKIYRVGGMQPRNPRGEKADNYSVADAAYFDPADGQWHWLPPMPHGRSSHDLAVVGDTLYVIGGWTMHGKIDGNQWLQSMLALDLKASRPVWKQVEQPFARRALIVAVHDEKIYVMGGMDDLDEITRRVDIFDPATQTWSRGPDLLGEARHAGFASAACVVDGRLYLSVAGGEMMRLTSSGDAWEKVARNTPRIVHRLVPHAGRVLVMGGADSGGNMDLIESVDPHASAVQQTAMSEQQ